MGESTTPAHDTADNNMCLSTPAHAISIIETNDNVLSLSANYSAELDSETYCSPCKQHISLSVARPFTSQRVSVSRYSKLTALAKVNLEPRDGERDDKTAAGKSNTFNSGESSRDRVATRRALRPRNTSSQPAGRSNNSDDEDEEDDEKRRRQKRKILSQCEAKSLATIAKSLDQEVERNTSQLPEQHHLQHHDQSLLMHGFSKLWNSMANMTLFGAHNQSAAALTAENGNTTLNYLNISINGGLTGEINPTAIPENIQFDPYVLELTPIKSRPEGENILNVPTVFLTTPDNDNVIPEKPACDDVEQAIVVPTILLTPTHEDDKNSEEPGGDGAFYTGRGNPEITPRRCSVRGDISNQSPSCLLTVTPKPRVRSRSESLTRPY